MEKRRIRLEINGVVCGLITQESEDYMQSLAHEVGDLMKEVLDASPFVTREAAALTAALSYCDDAKKNGKKASDLQERVDELEVEAELWQEEKAQMERAAPAPEDSNLKERLRALEERNTALEEAAGLAAELEARAARLEDENAALREAVRTAGTAAGKAESSELREQAEEAVGASRPGEERSASPEDGSPRNSPRNAGKRKNPLRHEDEYEQEGFVSFFEKK